jgi:DNA-binding CsgD family transcriptional regulator
VIARSGSHPRTTLSSGQLARIRALEDALLTIPCDEQEIAPVTPEAMGALQELLGADAVCAYSLRQAKHSDRQEVSSHRALGLDTRAFEVLFPAFVAGQTVQWGAYNPGCPEPSQRNRVVTVTSRELRARAIPIALDLFPKVGVGGSDQMRVLVCEGPSLLAWVGAWQAGGFEPHQEAILAALIPALQKRLQTVRLLEGGSRNCVVEAALDAIGRAAFVVAGAGRIVEANRFGRELLEREGRFLRAEVVAAVGARAAHPRWDVIPVEGRGRAPEVLVLARAWTAERVAAQIALATAQWTLTPRQREVLAKVAEGNANRTIAAMLGITERTVEVHVTALFEKAQVECRAELVARVYTLE